ncbi:hypothetical protein WKG84_12640 [Pantoea agglomerans]|uniref:dCTP deaminase domain-containing protein n=1 Tax=Pantoea TaxID=53335 RepID=UPI00351D46CB
MLTQFSFIEKCKTKKCVFFRSFDTNTKVFLEMNDDNEQKEIAHLESNSKNKGVRFALTLGPVVKRYNNKVPKKSRFKNKKYLEDLREGNNTLLLKPNETVSILSNEYLETDNETGAFIFPRLSLADVGIGIITTYVDPYWKGILQMTLVNNTRKTIKIKLGESIGVIFFYKTNSEVDESYRSSFPTNSHHYGQTWEKIIKYDAEPFLNKKTHEDRSMFDALRSFYEESQGILSKVFSGALIGGILISAGSFQNQFSEMKKTFEEYKDKKSSNYSGLTQLIVRKGDRYVNKVIDVNFKSQATPVILTKYQDGKTIGNLSSNVSEVNGDVISKISFNLDLGKPSKDNQAITIQWVLIP